MDFDAMFDAVKADRPVIKNGWYADLSNDDYHGSAGASSSVIKKFLNSTPAAVKQSLSEPNEPTPAMALGTAVHTLVLEPHKFDAEVAVMPELNLRTKDGREERDAFLEASAGLAVITPEQFELAKAMAESVLSNPTVKALMDGAVCEHSIFWEQEIIDTETGEVIAEQCKVRPDFIPRRFPVVADLKTTDDAGYSKYQRTIINFGYHISAAMYLQGVNQCRELLAKLGHERCDTLVHIVVEKKPPYQVAIYELGEAFIDIGLEKFKEGALKMVRGRRDNWPAYGNEIRVIEPPNWAKNSEEI